jgi:hypothetical protein
MSDKEPGEREHFSVPDMRAWLKEELRNVHKECELRTREATEFVTAYAAGELTPAEAHKRFEQYDERWGDPLAGVYASSFRTDEEVLKAIDRNNAGQFEGPGWSVREQGRKGSKGQGRSPK